MSRVQGETVYLVEVKGRDYRGRPITERTPLQAVVVPGRSDVTEGGDAAGWLNTAELTLLLPEFRAVEAGQEVEVRGHTYYVDGDGFDHRSAFGTARGGTELRLTREEVAL